VPSLSTYALFIVTALALLAIPGPAVLYVVGRSMVLASKVAFDAVRYVGAAYLIVLGVRRLLTRTQEDDPAEGRRPRPLRRLYTQGLVVNLLNPKTIVFIFAFIPQFVDVGAGRVWLQILLLGLTFAGLGLMSDSLYAIVAGTVADRLRGTPLIACIERWFGGTVLIGLGVAAAIIAPHRSN